MFAKIYPARGTETGLALMLFPKYRQFRVLLNATETDLAICSSERSPIHDYMTETDETRIGEVKNPFERAR